MLVLTRYCFQSKPPVHGIMDAINQLRARRQEIARLKAELDKEEQDLLVTERVLRKLSGLPDVEPSVRRVQLMDGLIRGNKALVVAALEDEPQPWMTADQIKSAIERTRGHIIGKSTLFPLLTAMKNEGLIVRNGRVVALAKRVEDRPVD